VLEELAADKKKKADIGETRTRIFLHLMDEIETV